MKNYLILAVVALLAVAVLVPTVFAADSTDSAKAWFEQKFATKKAWVDQAVNDGRITAEQGQAWKAHFDANQQFLSQNGYQTPCANPGSGMGGGRMGGKGMGYGRMGGGSMLGTSPVNSN